MTDKFGHQGRVIFIVVPSSSGLQKYHSVRQTVSGSACHVP